MKFEYKVVPAPERARKIRGLKGPALFAREMEELMNDLADDGWHYLRADTLPQEERSGLTGRVTTYRNLLVFQRPTAPDARDEDVASREKPAPPPEASANPEEAGTSAPEDDDVSNLWHAHDDEPSGPLVADRQGQRVDL